MNIIDLKNYLETKYGMGTIYFEETDSTNTEIKKEIYPENTVIIAKKQIDGKGRNGKSFLSPEGGIYLSVKLKKNDNNFDFLTSLSAVAVSRAIREVTGIETKIKWVNDIFIENKKVAGILCEAVAKNGKIQSVIIGIGINVEKVDFNEISDIADSLENYTSTKIDKSKLIKSLIDNLIKLYSNADKDMIIDECIKKSNVIGKNITVILKDKSFSGVCKGIDRNGKLLVESNGTEYTLTYGEISIKLKEK